MALLLASTLSGCLSPGSPPLDAASESAPTRSSDGAHPYPRCEHPWPCGDGTEWPANLTGPFELAPVSRVNVTSFDGTRLHGWLLRPDVPQGVGVPVLLGSTPYEGQINPKPGDAGFGAHAAEVYGVNLTRMAERGYAVAIFNIRGTGSSGGCLDWFGPKEQRDQVALVNWLGNRTWSNGRVAMLGLSYRAATAWQAAVHAPAPLKATVTAGVVTNAYTLYHTPQGAPMAPWAVADEQSLTLATTGPPVPPLQGPSQRTTVEWLQHAPTRACPAPAHSTAVPLAGAYSDQRDGAFWEARRIIDDVPNVTAATLLAHGFHDNRVHTYQESAIWHALPDATPKHMVQGHWSHDFPTMNEYRPEWVLQDWDARVARWLDFWLKGRGAPPATLGTVDYQDDHGAWHDATAWPPADARHEVLHLAPDGLSNAPERGSRAFRSAPDPAASALADHAIGFRGGEKPGPVCPTPATDGEPATFVAYVSQPVGQRTTIAGNPWAYLNITSSEPGGFVHVAVLDLGPDFRCDARGVPHDATWVTHGRADLRFHDGGYAGEDFPVGTPARVRVDLKDNAIVLEPGHRLGVWVSHGDPTHRSGQPHTPAVTVHGDSELVLPVVEGTLGGRGPTHAYPPRPFVPAGTP